MKIKALIFSVSLLISVGVCAQVSLQQVADEVWLNLIETSSVRYDFPPELKFIQSDNNPAYYSNEKIHVEEKLLELLSDSLGERFEDGLAYILAHELAHHNRQHVWTHFSKSSVRNTDVRAYGNRITVSIENESVADLDAGMNAHIAGYSSLDIAPRVLDLIYSSYELPDSIPGYPSLNDRKTIQKKRLEQFGDLSVFYEVAIMSLQLGNAEYAIKLLKSVLSTGYKTYEVYELLSYSYFMKAKSALPYRALEVWAFPIEMSDNRVLSSNTRGIVNIDWSLFIYDLNEAQRILDLANSKNIANENIALEKSIKTLLICVRAFDSGEDDWKSVFNGAAILGEVYEAFAYSAFDSHFNNTQFKDSKKILKKIEDVLLSDLIEFNIKLLNNESDGYKQKLLIPGFVNEGTNDVLLSSSSFGSLSKKSILYSIDGREKLKFSESKNWESIKLGSSNAYLVLFNIDSISIEDGFKWMLEYETCLNVEATKSLFNTMKTKSIHLLNEKLVLVFDSNNSLTALFTYI